MPYLPTERARRDDTWEADSPPPKGTGALLATVFDEDERVELGASPLLRRAAEPERPLVLTRSVSAALVVEQVCPRARGLGLRPGLSLGQAQALVPELAALPHEPQRDRAALQRLAHWVLRFSPTVEPVEPDTLLVDVTGCERLFGGERHIACQAAEGLAQQGFRARAAIADTVGAAYALAVAGNEPIIVVPVGQTSAYITPLPPRALRITPQVDDQLEALGIRSIGDVLMLPRVSLPARFGSQLGLRLQQVLGEVFEGVTPFQPEEAPSARQSFEVPVADGRAISSVAERLLAEVFAQMLPRELALRRLECAFYYEYAPPRVISIGLARACRERSHVAKLLNERLQNAGWAPPTVVSTGVGASRMTGRFPPAREHVNPTPGITGLMLVARETSRWHGGQGDLFEPRDPGDDEALGRLIDRLTGRLGYEAVVRPRLLDDHQPELAFRYESGHMNGDSPLFSDTDGQKTWDRPLFCSFRPVRLLPRAVPIRVIALVPDGPPTWFSYRGQEYGIVHAAGPERLETAWWRGPDVRRDYFRVTAESGEQFWIFRATEDRQWYVHGIFA